MMFQRCFAAIFVAVIAMTTINAQPTVSDVLLELEPAQVDLSTNSTAALPSATPVIDTAAMTVSSQAANSPPVVSPLAAAAAAVDALPPTDGPEQIINGNALAVNPGWVVSIAGNSEHYCTGSLIAASWVLTAAHCVFSQCIGNSNPITGKCDASKFASDTVRVGGVNFDDLNSTFLISTMAAVYANPIYMSVGANFPAENNGLGAGTYQYDVALIQLATPATNYATIPYSCSPLLPPVGTTVFTYGWGECLGDSCSGTPNPVNGVVNNQRTLQWTGPNGLKIVSCGLNDSPANACTFSTTGVGGGDSGGPNVMKANGRDLLVSITSWGYGPSSLDKTPFNGEPFKDGSLRTGSVCSYIKTTSGVLPADQSGPLPGHCCGIMPSQPGINASACRGKTFNSRCIVKCAPGYRAVPGSFSSRWLVCTKTNSSPGWLYKGTYPRCVKVF